MSRLLLVSNRLSITVEKRKDTLNFRQSVGGLATGLSSFYKDRDCVWIGWCGVASNNLDSKTKEEIEKKLLTQYDSYTTFLSKKDVKMFYSGFCNKTIWPLFHYFPDYAIYNHEHWESYKQVNKLFCQTVLKIAKPDDIIWIHDYHLFLLPALLREKLPNAQIGFFLHIPFPSYEIFRLLPWRKEILKGILGADLIGFHTYDYVRHFNSSVRRLLGYEHILGRITINHRIVKVDAFPMGIDYDRFANAKIDMKWSEEIKNRCDTKEGHKIILSVDRLDYTKGIPQRLEAFDLFLEKYPEYKKRVTLIMVAVPSRISVETYKKLKKEVDELVGRINGKHGTINWMPVWYLYRFLPFENIVSLYNIADVALVTPLRDGMNLIAKEYIAAKKNSLGILVLSEMAGAMTELSEAVIVNPNNREEVTESMKEALTMPPDEQIERMNIMKQRLKRYNVITWAKDFLGSLSQIKKEQNKINSKILTDEIQKVLLKKYTNAKNRLFVLDYDGTLVPFAEKPQKAKPDDEIYGLIQSLSKNPKNEVILISGRDKDTLENWFGQLDVNLSAEHGVWIKTKKGTWDIVEPLEDAWKEQIRPILELYVDRTPGSFIEEKSFSLAWHYRKSNHELSAVRARELKDDLFDLTANLNLMILEGSKVIEIKNGSINKGRAALQWISKKDWDFILAVGDDWTDEDLFEVLPDSAYSIKVGLGISRAKFYLTNYSEVRKLVKKLVEI